MAISSSLLLLSIPLILSAAASPLPFPNPAGEPPQKAPSQAATALLPRILSNLGFQELAMAVPSLSYPIISSPWSSPVTIFAPSDDTIRSCGASCFPARLLREHVVRGVFPRLYLSKLSFGTKIETVAPNRCVSITSIAGSDGAVKILVDGVEITRPDLFDDGQIVIHGIQGFIAPLSPVSCSSDRSSSEIAGSSVGPKDIAGVMLRDAIVSLRAGGYSILALAVGIKWPELAELQNMTVFTLDDAAIFGGGHAYVTEVRFHVVPNQLLMHSDLMKLPEGVVLPTLVKGQHLVVTQNGGSGLRINYVPIKEPDVVYNSKIVVHSLYFPFPHLYLADQAYAEADLGEGILESSDVACGVLGSPGECKMAPTPAPAASFTLDHHGSL